MPILSKQSSLFLTSGTTKYISDADNTNNSDHTPVPATRMPSAIPSRYEISSLDPRVRFDSVAHSYVETGSDGVPLPSSTLLARILTPETSANTGRRPRAANDMEDGSVRHAAWTKVSCSLHRAHTPNIYVTAHIFTVHRACGIGFYRGCMVGRRRGLP
jgi:hypothetical protein